MPFTSFQFMKPEVSSLVGRVRICPELVGQSHRTVTRSGSTTMLQRTCSQFKLLTIDENRALRDKKRSLQEENIELKSKLKAAQAALRRLNFFIAEIPAIVLPLTMKQIKGDNLFNLFNLLKLCTALYRIFVYDAYSYSILVSCQLEKKER
jgi:hypothetical protein